MMRNSLMMRELLDVELFGSCPAHFLLQPLASFTGRTVFWCHFLLLSRLKRKFTGYVQARSGRKHFPF